jgi:cation diffusion facilitator CzcD-associated flavoprotein CzcO
MEGMGTERFETVVVGGGQAGLATGYHLARRGRPFVILDAGQRVGDPWRRRWDSLRLVGWVGRDAEHVVGQLAARTTSAASPVTVPGP